VNLIKGNLLFFVREIVALMSRFNTIHQMISVVLEVIILYLVYVFEHVMRKEKAAFFL